MSETPNPPEELEQPEIPTDAPADAPAVDATLPPEGEPPTPAEDAGAVQDELPGMQDMPGTTIPGSTYEMVVVASREARRLNDSLRRLTDERPEKVTSRAIGRVLAGQVRFAYDDSQSS